MSSVSLIVPAYIVDDSVWTLYERLIGSLRATTPREAFQFVVVENGSNRCTSGDIYIHKPSPIGYARAVNIGMALADGDYLVVANVDIEVGEGWLDKLIAEYVAHGPGVMSPDDHGRTGVWEESWYGLWMTDRATFTRVGYLDESLPYRFHDQAYSIEMVKRGFKVQRTGAVQVRHAESSTFNKMGLDVGPEAAEMYRRYGCHHFREWREQHPGACV